MLLVLCLAFNYTIYHVIIWTSARYNGTNHMTPMPNVSRQAVRTSRTTTVCFKWEINLLPYIVLANKEGSYETWLVASVSRTKSYYCKCKFVLYIQFTKMPIGLNAFLRFALLCFICTPRSPFCHHSAIH